jgi:hypothetical protein
MGLCEVDARNESAAGPRNSSAATRQPSRSRIQMPNERSSSGCSRGSPSEMTKLSTWTYTRYTPRLSGGIYEPERTSFELQLNSETPIWLARTLAGGRSPDAQHPLPNCLRSVS